MAYLTQTELEQYTGFGSQGFKIAGAGMTATQWATFCSWVIDRVTHAINHECNVTSFEFGSTIEYHNGRGASGDNDQYQPFDKEFYLHEPYYAMISVEEDIGGENELPDWDTRTERTAAATGDYMIISRDELVKVRFHDNIPQQGYDNVRITYYTGYATASTEMEEINDIAVRMAANWLIKKRKQQEVQTIRDTGVRNFSEMYGNIDMDIITPDIRQDLHRHKRYRMGGSTWD